jgi:hypothetical protein
MENQNQQRETVSAWNRKKENIFFGAIFKKAGKKAGFSF